MKSIGYQRLVEMFALETLGLPRVSWLKPKGSERITRFEGGKEEEIYPPRYDPGDGWQGNLQFALKHEGVNLEVLSALFRELPIDEFTRWIKTAPLSRYIRIAWFLHEWFGGEKIKVRDLTQGNYLPVLDESRFYAITDRAGQVSVRRQRIINNLPGSPEYCPTIRRTAALSRFEAKRLDQRASTAMGRYPKELLRRASRFLYIKETKSSFAIEKLEPDQKRTGRFVNLLEEAGRLDCYSERELVRLQNEIVEARYAEKKFRDFQNYVGQSLGITREIIHFIPPKTEDLEGLMSGWIRSCKRIESGGIHPVVTAAAAGFGFVYLHPFEDGNGRLHRFLIQHALAAGGFGPKGVLFPVSATILNQLDRYDAALEIFSKPLMERVEYRLDAKGRMRVLNETARFYRYPDLTGQAEALFGFIEDTIDKEMVAELDYLTIFDEARIRIREVVDMPDRRMDLFLRICLAGRGRISKAKRDQFKELDDSELARMERIVREAMAKASGKDRD